MADLNFIPVPVEQLRALCMDVFQKLGTTHENARIITDVTLAADLRGIDSHGVGRLGFYVNYIRQGVIKLQAQPEVVYETPISALIDAHDGMGQPVSHQAMQLAIRKAEETGIGLVTVRSSNHYGIAGYYAMMALEKDLIGSSMTNASVFVSPTFGRDAMMGTNPIAVAVPCGEERPWVMDMATSIVPFGKLETYDRLGKELPLGWVTDETGQPSSDPLRVMTNLRSQPVRGGMLPLGGFGELMGGHKGYGLVTLVDILCGVLPGAFYANLVNPHGPDGTPLPAGLGHFFAALRIDAIRPVAEFKAGMDDLVRRLRGAPKAEGCDRIYIHGEKEYESTERRQREGVPLSPRLHAELCEIAREFNAPFPA